MSRWMPDTPGIIRPLAQRVPFQILHGLAGQKRKKPDYASPAGWQCLAYRPCSCCVRLFPRSPLLRHAHFVAQSQTPRNSPLCIRLLPRVLDGETLVGPRVKDARLWEPVVSQLRHSSQVRSPFWLRRLSVQRQRSMISARKGSQRSPVGWHCVVVEEAGDDLLQPFTLFGDRLMHPPSQFPCNILDLRLHAVA